MNLYQEIIFLENYFSGKWCVENVIPYYTPLIPAQKRGRHLYWTNFILPQTLSNRTIQISAGDDEVSRLCEFHEYNFRQYNGEQRIDKVARNLVDFEAGLTVFQCAVGAFKSNSIHQTDLWNTNVDAF